MRRHRSPGFAVPPVMFIVAVIATVTGATITMYEAYEKYYVRPAQEADLSRLKDENARLKQELDLVKQENATLKQVRSSEQSSHPDGAELLPNYPTTCQVGRMESTEAVNPKHPLISGL